MTALPELHLSDWRATKDTLHQYSQILGKIRLSTTPPRNHWWNVPLWCPSPEELSELSSLPGTA
jgi:Family of unknown function (DUF5996)